MKTDDLAGWRAFIAVAQYGNFAKASRELNVPVSILSKRVSKLEDQLGVRLFQRSTRVVTQTDEGKTLLPKVRAFLDELNEIENTFSEKKELSGVVRITSVSFVAHNLLIPIIKDFQNLHPKIKVQLSLSEKLVNIIESNFDMAIRIQDPEDTELIYRKLAPNNLIFCATPKYLKSRKTIQKPEDLLHHDLLFLKIHESCKFIDTKEQLKKFISRKMIECDNGAFLTDMALNDCGVLVRSIWDVEKHLHQGTLVQV